MSKQRKEKNRTQFRLPRRKRTLQYLLISKHNKINIDVLIFSRRSQFSWEVVAMSANDAGTGKWLWFVVSAPSVDLEPVWVYRRTPDSFTSLWPICRQSPVFGWNNNCKKQKYSCTSKTSVGQAFFCGVSLSLLMLEIWGHKVLFFLGNVLNTFHCLKSVDYRTECRKTQSYAYAKQSKIKDKINFKNVREM